MAKKDTASKRPAEAAHAYARYTINLQRAFGDLLSELKRAYGQPARDAADTRSQHALALLAIAGFLNRVGPDGDPTHFANQFAKLAQTLQDLNEGVLAPMLYPALPKRSDQTLIWLARAHVALAVETIQRCGHSKKRAAKWAAKKHPGLEQLITESGSHRSKSLEKAIISWCEDFSSHKIRNDPTRINSASNRGHLMASRDATWNVQKKHEQLPQGWLPLARRPHLQSERIASRGVMDVGTSLRTPRGPHANARLCGDTRGRDGGIRQELAARELRPCTH
jgi:hypothetical protein